MSVFGARSRAEFLGLPLSPREQQVLSGIASGLTAKAIAAELGISEWYCRHLRDRILAKLGARSSAHAVALARQEARDGG